MKKILKSAWIIFCIVLALLFIVSCFSAYVSPTVFSYMPLFAIAFPYLFILMLVSSLISLYIKRKTGVILLLCLLPGLANLLHIVAFNLPQTSADKKNDSTLRIMTWNVEDFIDLTAESVVRPQMLRVITQKNPDVLCLQEFTNVEGAKRMASVRKELDSLGFIYHFFSNDEVIIKRNKTVIIRGSALFSKTVFTDSGRIVIRSGETNENLIYATLNFNGRPLRVYTTHLASFELYKDTDKIKKDVYEITYERKRVIQYKLREVEQLHREEAAMIRDTMSKTGLPVVYCGDMNAVPCSYTYHLLKNDLRDAFLAKGSGIGATFYKVLPMLRIDYCFADKRFNITGCTVIRKKLSDHYPLVTDMQWK